MDRSQTAAPQGGLAVVTRRPVAITMFVLALAVFGFVSFKELRVDLLPEISYPTLTVRTTWTGSAPEDVEERVSERVQEALSTLPNLVRSTSISRAGVSDVVLDFNWGTEMTFAVQDAREKLDGVFLPQGADRPLILRYDPNLDPILRVGVRSHRVQGDRGGEDELIQLRWVAEHRIKREIEALNGVAAVQVRGGLEEEVRVLVDPFKLAAHNIDPSTLAMRLAQENINASGGSVREGSTEYLVRTLNEFQDVEEIADLAVVRRGDGVIRVRDVAKVERTHKEREVVSRLGGSEAVEIAIYREAGANIVQVADAVKARLFGTEQQRQDAEDIQRREEAGERDISQSDRAKADYLAFRLRKSAALELLSDQSTFIQGAVDDVKNAALLGALFAVVVIWIFLRQISATLIISAAIPISVVVTFAPMHLFGVSLNIMSLGGLALGVGMLVDNAIVVLESITRCREEGDPLDRAAVRGVREVAGAVTASTLTTIAVFAPIVFVTGIAGQIFGDQALTVVTSLLVSLGVAVFFIPMLASRRFLAPKREGEEDPEAATAQPPPGLGADLSWRPAAFLGSLVTLLTRLVLLILGLLTRLVAGLVLGIVRALGVVFRPFSRAFDAFWNAGERVYGGLLGGALRMPLLIVAASLGLLYLAADRAGRLGVELLPEIRQGEFTAHVRLDIGSPLESTEEVMGELDRAIRGVGGAALSDFVTERVATTALTVGVERETLTRDIEGSHTARLTVRLGGAPDDGGEEERAVSPEEEDRIVEEVRVALSKHPAVTEVDIRRPTPFALESPIAVEVRGYDLDRLGELADQVYARLETIEELSNLRTSMRPGHPEALITFDRDKTLEYGLDLAAVSNLVRDEVQGNVSTRLNEGEERIDVRVIGDEIVLSTLDAVLDLVVNPSSPTPVPLHSVASFRLVQGPAEIRRLGNTRGVVITADGSGLDLGGLMEKIEAALGDLVVPEDMFVELGGQKREMEEAQTSMRFALLLAVFLVYVVMASQFESLLQPFVILLTVPLAGVGVVFALEALDVPLSVVVFIGLIMLAGIVVNNAIVLVDRINQNRARGLELHPAVIEAAKARLRPILMTTTTTALGLLPMTGWLAGIPVVGEFGSSEGAEMRAPMAMAVVTGLVSSTVLTLIVIPTVYSLVSRRWRPPTQEVPA